MRASQRILHSVSYRAALLLRRGHCRSFASDTSGARTLGAVVRELRRDGRLPAASSGFQPESETPSWVSDGFLDIDSELAAGLSVEDDDADEDDLVTPAVFSVEQHGPDVDVEQHGPDMGFTGGSAAEGDDLGLKGSVRQGAIEDVSHLSEEELRERVRRSIEDLIPSDTAGAVSSPSADSAGSDLSGLTPAQVFYMENREKLVFRAQTYYLEKQRELQLQQEEGVPAEVEDEWRYYHEPVVRPPKGHLWSTGEEENPDDHGLETGWLETVSDWPEGVLPTADMLAELLRSEQARDVFVQDFEACGRRDVGTYGIAATGVTSQHCRRLGEIVARATENCRVPHIEAWCYGTRKDEWVVAHCGPIKVHIFTREMREQYNLELLWESPEQFFQPGDFPHYVEIYGSATTAFMSPSGLHVTEPGGSRSAGLLPPPFRDTLHASLMQPDYDAADDTHYVSPNEVLDVGGRSSRSSVQTEKAEVRVASFDDTDLAQAQARSASARRSLNTQPLGDESDTDEEGEDAPARKGRRSRRQQRGERAPLERL